MDFSRRIANIYIHTIYIESIVYISATLKTHMVLLREDPLKHAHSCNTHRVVPIAGVLYGPVAAIVTKYRTSLSYIELPEIVAKGSK